MSVIVEARGTTGLGEVDGDAAPPAVASIATVERPAARITS